MNIGERIKTLRERKGLTQGDIEKRSNLLRCYISRVEDGHTIPTLENLERFSRALEVPLCTLFSDGCEIAASSLLTAEQIAWASGSDASVHRLMALFERLKRRDRRIVIETAERLSKIWQPSTDVSQL